jgi:hypothetical protein
VLSALYSPRARRRGVFTIDSFVNMALEHKHLKLDQAKIDRAKRLLRAKTEQETIDRALDLLLAEEAILRVHKKIRGGGGFVDVFSKANGCAALGNL